MSAPLIERTPMPDALRPIPPVKPRHFPPPPPLVDKAPGLWRRTPPAIFPPMLGLFGLGLAWRTMAAQPGLTPLAPVGEAILGATLLLYAFSLVAWLSKPIRRPAVVIDDLRVLPGRAGLAAMTLCLALAAASLVPYAPGLALNIAFADVAVLIVLGMLIAGVLATGPDEQRMVTPIFHLSFAGYILSALTFAQLGLTGFATGILIATTAAATFIWLVSLRQILTRIPPAPLRPLLAIHAAPAALFATVSATLGYPTLAAGFALLALAIVTAIVASARWLLAAGFSPLWGALTFPLAATATASIVALGQPGLYVGAALLIAATALNPWITFRVIKAWAKGQLAAKTNAATA